jgi:hypothetical protein
MDDQCRPRGSRGERYGTGSRRQSGLVSSRSVRHVSMLAILCFLRRLAEYTTQMDQWHGILATDSLSLLETITEKPTELTGNAMPFGQRKRVKDLDVKCPEWDLLSSILVENWNVGLVYSFNMSAATRTARRRMIVFL